MRHLVSFSGGKDSTALILWAIENLKSFDVVFADTGWEHPLTYDYIDYIESSVLIKHGSTLHRVKSAKYEGFEDLSIKKKRVASTKARFCTQELKLYPIHDFIHSNDLGNESTTMYIGIRADESPSRARLTEEVFDLDYYGCWIRRPLLKWTSDDVFAIMKKHGIEPNPLYKMGMKRVGCMPCIMSSLSEIKEIAKRFPEVIDKVSDLEKKVGRSFFPAGKIPDWATSNKDDNGIKYPMIQDVVRYVQDDPSQISIFEDEPQSCMSHFNICE